MLLRDASGGERCSLSSFCSSPVTPSPRTSEHVGGKAIAVAKYAPVNTETAQIMEISVTGLSALKKSCTVQEATVLTISLKKYKQLLDM